MKFDKIKPPTAGEQIRANPDSSISVPDQPIIPFI